MVRQEGLRSGFAAWQTDAWEEGIPRTIPKGQMTSLERNKRIASIGNGQVPVVISMMLSLFSKYPVRDMMTQCELFQDNPIDIDTDMVGGDVPRWLSRVEAFRVYSPGRVGLVKPPKGYRPEDEYVEVVQKTSRKNRPAAITPRFVEQYAPKSYEILDYGAGVIAEHARRLKKSGFRNIRAYDFSFDGRYHDRDALFHTYDLVYASNVLNVQQTATMMGHTIEQIYGLVRPGGFFVANYPTDPRYATYDPQTLLAAIATKFGNPVIRVNRSNAAPLFFVRKA